MRSTSLCCLIAAMAVAAEARGQQTRVVFCAERTGPCAALRPLGRSAEGFWAKASDAELLANRGSLPVLLYANAPELADALAGLDAKGRQEAIAHRRAYLAQHPGAGVSGMLESDMRELAAAVADAAAPELPLLLAADVELGGDDSCALVATPDAALSLAREDLARLIVDLPAGPLAKGYSREATALAELYRPFCRRCQEGREVPMPFAEPTPAYFVPSLSDQDFRALAHGSGSPHRWRGGVVALLSPRDLDRPPLKGQAVRMLYLGKQPYLHDVFQLSEAQLSLRLQLRMKGIPTNERAVMVAEQAWKHASWSRLVTTCLEGKSVSWFSGWRSIVDLATENLRLALRLAYPRAGAERSKRLRELREDLDLALALEQGSQRPARLKRVRELVERLPP